MPEQRRVRLFRNGRNQAVRIPAEFELPGTEAIMHRDGDRLVIEPVRKRGLIALLRTMKPLQEEFPEMDDPYFHSGEVALTLYCSTPTSSLT
jgi:antitoxin VapB